MYPRNKASVQVSYERGTPVTPVPLRAILLQGKLAHNPPPPPPRTLQWPCAYGLMGLLGGERFRMSEVPLYRGTPLMKNSPPPQDLNRALDIGLL